MEKRECENSGLKLSVLGAGCWAFGGGKYWGKQDQNQVNNVVHASVEHGINYFDTAEAYNEGRSESSLGMAMKGIPRNKIFIGTKVSPSNCYNDTLIEHCHDSLKRLQTDYIDLYMIHWPIHSYSISHFTSDITIINSPPNINETLDALYTLRQQGKIQHFGVSNFSSNRLAELPLEEVAINELPYNLLCRAIEYDVLPFCKEKGIGVIGYMPLLQGILTDMYPSLDDVPAWQRRTRHFNCKTNKECRHGKKGIEKETNNALMEIRSICKETGYSLAEISVMWILQNPSITCALVGSRNIDELEANLKAVYNPMSKELKAKLDNITLPVMEKLGNHFDYYENPEYDRTL